MILMARRAATQQMPAVVIVLLLLLIGRGGFHLNFSRLCGMDKLLVGWLVTMTRRRSSVRDKGYKNGKIMDYMSLAIWS